MQDQFLTLKKSKNRAIGESDKQEDAIIDMRCFYQCEEDEDQHFRDALVIKGKPSNEEDNGNEPEKAPPSKEPGKEAVGKKKKYVDKEEMEKKRPMLAK
jgi:hypothetical protein